MKTAANPAYTRYHPRWHRRRMPIFWWLRKWAYTRFIVRELTSLAVGYVAVLLLVQAWFLSRGPEAYQAFAATLQRPGVVAFHTLVLVGLLTHTVTWLNAAPSAIVVRARGRRLPSAVVVLGHYGLWAVLSAAVFWLLAGR